MNLLHQTDTAGFDEPVALLMACHGRVRHFAALLPKLVEHMQQAGQADQMTRDAAAAILRYFDVAAPLHHQDEDEDLYPLMLERAGEALRATIQHIMAEHVVLGSLWQRLRPVLQGIAAGEHLIPEHELVEAFSTLYPAHASKEDEDIYPHANHLLTLAELTALGQRMASRRMTV